MHPTRAGKAGSWLHFRLGRATEPRAASGRPCGYAHRPQPACCHVTRVRSGKGDSQSTTTDREANLGVSGSHLVPPGRPSSWLGHLSKISRKEWNPCQAGGRPVAVDVDPNTQKKDFFKIFQFRSRGHAGFSQPAKTAYQSRKPIENGVGKSTAHVGWFWSQTPNFEPVELLVPPLPPPDIPRLRLPFCSKNTPAKFGGCPRGGQFRVGAPAMGASCEAGVIILRI